MLKGKEPDIIAIEVVTFHFNYLIFSKIEARFMRSKNTSRPF